MFGVTPSPQLSPGAEFLEPDLIHSDVKENAVADEIYHLNLFIPFEETHLLDKNQRVWKDHRFVCIAAKEELTGKPLIDLIRKNFEQGKPYVLKYICHKTEMNQARFKLFDATEALKQNKTLIKGDLGEEFMILYPKRPDKFRLYIHQQARVNRRGYSHYDFGVHFIRANNGVMGSNLMVANYYRGGDCLDEPNHELAQEYALKEARTGCVVSREFLQKFYNQNLQATQLPRLIASERCTELPNVLNSFHFYILFRNLIEEKRLEIDPQIISFECRFPEGVVVDNLITYELSCIVNDGKQNQTVRMTRSLFCYEPSLKQGDPLEYFATWLYPVIVALDPHHPNHLMMKEKIYEEAFLQQSGSVSFYDKKNEYLTSYEATHNSFKIKSVKITKNNQPLTLEWKHYLQKKVTGNEKESCILS